MKKLLSLLLSAAILLSLFSVTALPAIAADDTIDAVVTELTIGDHTGFLYTPESELTVASCATAPCFIVFGNKAYTAETAKAEAVASGLAKLAAQEGASVAFVNPLGDTWGDADVGVFLALQDMYSDSTSTYVNGIDSKGKIAGAVESRVYVYANGAGADFVAANYMKIMSVDSVKGNGDIVSADRTAVSVNLFNLTALPVFSETADIAVSVINGPADAAQKLAALTEKYVVTTSSVTDGFDKDWIITNYTVISGAYRRQADVTLPVHNYAAEGIKQSIESYTLSDGVTVNYVVFHSNDLNVTDKSNPKPLIMVFHGGGNTALGVAQTTEWPEIAKANGLIAASVDNHTAYDATQMAELLQHLKEEFAIDATRVYASGFSMGGIKSWDLFDQYPTLFAGVAPMDAGNAPGENSTNKDVVTPVFYVAGQDSPLMEMPWQAQKIKDRLAYAFSVNGVAQEYSYDADVNFWWGVNGDLVYQVTDQVAFKDSTMTLNLFQSSDGHYYTAIADVSNQSHEIFARNCWAAWDFLRQFSRNEDGSISISKVTYTLASDDGKITNNGYNIGEDISFEDVEADAYYYDAVMWAVEKGITEGTSNTTFTPNGYCIREQIVTFLWRAAGSPEPKTTVNPFTDVESETDYYKAILWAAENDIAKGTSPAIFAPKASCSREQILTLIWRAANSPEPKSTTNPFTDVEESSYCYKAILWAVENGITMGTSANTFAPGDTCTRAQSVTFLYRACDFVK